MDSREIRHNWYSRFDKDRMTLTIYEDDEAEFTVPAKYDVCSTCEGRGSHVNPSIDSHGLSREDFDEDPDFEEDYRSGAYDVSCVECRGNRVVPVVDEARATKEELEKVEKAIEDHYANQRESWYEREHGY